ncbi:Sensory domain found in PocR [anaerobic digester metagenome]
MNVTLQDILTEDFIHQFQESFALSTGFGVVFVDLNGNHLGSGSNFSRLCQEINKSPEGAAYCANTNRQAIEIALESKKPSIYICHAGLVNIEIPLTFEGEYIGAITAGQVRCSDLNEFPKDNVGQEFEWLKTKEASEFLKSIKTLTREEIQATAVSLQNIANYIVQTVMFNKLQERLAEQERFRLEYEKKQLEMEHRIKLAELDALQKQVTPHFMFNVLNSVSRLISMNENDTAKTMVDSFSKMLRYSLYDSNATISLGTELEYINNYLSIQKQRFSGRLNYQIKVDPSTLGVEIPFFSLQPFVENALEHGILPKEKGGTVQVTCFRQKERIRIEITDNGIGMTPNELSHLDELLRDEYREGSEQVGIRNSYRRFKILFGKEAEVNIKSKKKFGTAVEIQLLDLHRQV